MTLMAVAAGGAATVLLTGLVDRILMAGRRRRPPRIKKPKAGKMPQVDGQAQLKLQRGADTAAPPATAAKKAVHEAGTASPESKGGTKKVVAATRSSTAEDSATPAPAPLAADTGIVLARRG